MSDLANQIVEALPDFSVTHEVDGELVDTRTNYLIMFLNTISPDSIIDTELLEDNMRGLYLQELERVRRALLREIRNTGYPLNSIRDNLRINIDENQPPASPMNTTLEYTRESDGTMSSVFPSLRTPSESPSPAEMEESLSRFESGVDNTDFDNADQISTTAESIPERDQYIMEELGPVAETSYTLDEGPSFMSISREDPNLSFESDISAIENEPARPSSRSSSFSDEDREVARFIFREGRSRSNSRGSTSSSSTSGEPERRGGKKKSHKKNKKRSKNKTKRKRKRRS